MHSFDSNGVEIAYSDTGTGAPILLIHGFASNSEVNWFDTGWVETLTRARRRVIAIDNRGHGMSEKLYDSEKYAAPVMAGDAARLLDHLKIARADIMGYSMGARIAAFLAMNQPEKVRSAIFAGLGINMVRGLGGAGPIASALEAPSIDDVSNETARTFRAFAQSTNSDLLALAACIRASRDKITPEALGAITAPVLVAVGTKDVIGGSPGDLAALIPGARALDIEGRDHMKAVGDRSFKERMLDFLDGRA
jgi:pimeloyl-ACP methyl ester carboxylesterase